MADYTDVALPKKANPAGTLLKLSIAPLSTVTTDSVPDDVDTAANLADIVESDTDIVFATGGRFYKLELEVNKNELNSAFQGAVRGGHQMFDFTGFCSNLGSDVLGLLQKASFETHVVLVHLADGKVLKLGTIDNGALIKYNTQSGVFEGGERGIPVMVKWYGYPIIYTGAVSYTAAV